MSPQIESLDVHGLFGYLRHHVEFRTDSTTILTGPNGSGKTHVLKLVRALVALDFDALIHFPFEKAILKYRSGLRLDASRDATNGMVLIQGFRANRSLGKLEVSLRKQEEEFAHRSHLPPWVDRLDENEWFDSEDNEFISTDELRRRYPGIFSTNLTKRPSWLAEYVPDSPPTFIEIGRLDVSQNRSPSRRRVAGPRKGVKPQPAISHYVEQISSQVKEAKQISLSVSQQADRRFAARALDKARASIREPALRAQYEIIAKLHHALHANGLTEEAIDVEFPAGRTNPTERRIINVFLEDWTHKLAPLIPVHEKLQTLRKIVEAKMTDKKLVLSSDGKLSFNSPTGQVVSAEYLSSGEQHMLALFTMLLFSAERGGLVLIDEPEISLHAAWKHGFLEDLDSVSKITPTTVILATHSTALINSRWELVEELELPSA